MGRYRAAREAALALYAIAASQAESSGILVADTKFEFGVAPDGTVMLGDEALTPDSSRFWPLDGYTPGRPQPSFDKQYARDWCAGTGWDRTEPGPELPPEVVAGTRARYVEAFERLTGIAFGRYLEDPEVVLCD
jgi:phosphoribosylaminoimidazole-succinocarboxamide synthase